MDLHPMVVHFPIALLSVYAAVEFARFEFIRRRPQWFETKALLVVLGAISALVARQTGELREPGYRGSDIENVLEMHKLFANISVVIFGLIALLYLIAWLERNGIILAILKRFYPTLVPQKRELLTRFTALASGLTEGRLILLVAAAGFAALAATGGLGGSLVYGPAIDPVVQLLYRILF